MYGRMVSKSINWLYIVLCSFIYKFDAPNSFLETLNKTKFTLRFRPVHYIKRCYFETGSHADNVGCRLYEQVSILALHPPRDSPTLLRTPISAKFSITPKLTTQLPSCCNAFWGNIYPFTMHGPPREIMTREKIFFLRMTSDVTYLWVCHKTISRIRIPTQRK